MPCLCATCNQPMTDCEWKVCEKCFVKGLDGPGENVYYGGNFKQGEVKQ